MTRVAAVDVVETCESTQQLVHSRLDAAADRAFAALRARRQTAGRGRQGRTWHDPPGRALLLSIGRRGPLPVDVLEHLPRAACEAVLEAVEPGVAGSARRLRWRAPNDIVAVSDGAKVGGVLVDARTIGSVVERVVVGIGVNVGGDPFSTPDGRSATSLASVTGTVADEAQVAALAAAVAAGVADLLGVSSPA